MSQSADFVLGTGLSGTNFRTELNDKLDNIITSHSGTSRPAYATQGTHWLDTTGGVTSLVVKFFDGSDDITVGTINATANTYTPAGAASQNGASNYGASSGGTDSYAVTTTPTFAAYTTGMEITFKADVANTGAATLNVNSVGAQTIKKNVNVDLVTGDIKANQNVKVSWDGTNWQLLSVTDSDYLVNVQTTITAYDDADYVMVADNSDSFKTKKITIANLVAGFPSGIFSADYASSGQTITTAGSLTLAHGLGAKPKIVRCYLKCLTAQYNYSIGDEIDVSNTDFTVSATRLYGHTFEMDATNIYVYYSDVSNVYNAQNASTRAVENLTNANWALYVEAYA